MCFSKYFNLQYSWYSINQHKSIIPSKLTCLKTSHKNISKNLYLFSGFLSKWKSYKVVNSYKDSKKSWSARLFLFLFEGRVMKVMFPITCSTIWRHFFFKKPYIEQPFMLKKILWKGKKINPSRFGSKSWIWRPRYILPWLFSRKLQMGKCLSVSVL